MATIEAPADNINLRQVAEFLKNFSPGSNPLINRCVEMAKMGLEESSRYHNALMQSQQKSNDLEHELNNVTDDRDAYKTVQKEIQAELVALVDKNPNALTKGEKEFFSLARETEDASRARFRGFVFALMQGRLDSEKEKQGLMKEHQTALATNQEPKRSDQELHRFKTLLSICHRVLSYSIGSALAIWEKDLSENQKAQMLKELEPALTCFLRAEDLLKWRLLKPVYGSNWETQKRYYVVHAGLAHFSDPNLKQLLDDHRARFEAGNPGKRGDDAPMPDAAFIRSVGEKLEGETDQQRYVLDVWIKDIFRGFDVNEI